MIPKTLLFPLLLTATLLAGTVRAEPMPLAAAPPDRPLLGIDGGDLALAAAAGASVGAAAALVVGDAVLAAGAGTLIAIYVGHLLLEALAVGGAIYVWPEGEQDQEQARPSLKPSPNLVGELRLATTGRAMP